MRMAVPVVLGAAMVVAQLATAAAVLAVEG